MSKRATLIVLALLFFGPMFIAWTWFFFFKDVRPGTVNKGDLIQPPVPIAELALFEREGENPEASRPFTGDWSVVVIAPYACDNECERALYLTRQVRIRLNRDAYRVQRVLIAGPDVSYPENEHPDLKVFDADTNAISAFSSNDNPLLAGDDRIYLVDPFGNLMMSYPMDFTPEMLNSDLQRVLRISEADKNDD